MICISDGKLFASSSLRDKYQIHEKCFVENMDNGNGFCFAHDHKFMYFCFYLSIFSRLVSDVSLTARATVKFTSILSFVYRSQLIFDDNDKEELAYQKCLPLAIVPNQFKEDVVILKCFLLDMYNMAFLIKVLKITHSTKYSLSHIHASWLSILHISHLRLLSIVLNV